MRYIHGGYTFPEGSVGIVADTKERVRSPRDKPYIMRRTMTLEGELKGTSQSDIRAKLLLMQTAFTSDTWQSGLVHDDGSDSVHFLRLLNALTVVRVLRTPSFTRNDPAEYTTYRSFTFVVQADFALQDADTLFAFSETVNYRGNCGPRKVQIELDTGAPDEQIVSQQTVQYISQSGQAVGIGSYPTTPDPLYPELMQNPDEGLSYQTPQPQGTGFTLYPVRWQYTMASDIPRNGAPIAR